MAYSSPSLSAPRHMPAFLHRNIPAAGVFRLHFSVRPIDPPSASTALMACAAAADGSPDLLNAAKHAVDNHIRSGMVVGLGSGRASSVAIRYLGRRLRAGALKGIVGVPTSIFSASEAAKAGIPLDKHRDSLQIDFAFDDADAMEEGTLTAIIGRREVEVGESLIEEKSILKAAGTLAFIVAEKQYRRVLDGCIPVLVNSGCWMDTAEEIDDLFLGDAEVCQYEDFRIPWNTELDSSSLIFMLVWLPNLKVWRRPTSGKAGPLGGDFPLVTKEGHHILDVIFTSSILDLAKVGEDLDQIAGVIGHGVIYGIPCTAIIVSQNGVLSVDNLS